MALREKQLLTCDEFEAFIARPENGDRHFELIDGEIIEKVPTQLHGFIAARLTILLGIFLQQHPLGRIGLEVRHKIPDDMHNARQPDLAVYLDTTSPPIESGAVPSMPDLAIEIQSPSDSPRRLREKAAYYLAHGCRAVWLVYTEKQFVEVYTEDAIQILVAGDTLTGGDLLPGFSLPVNDIFSV